MVETAFLLAGGLGTRLRSVVPQVPKPMAPVAGRPFLEHLLDYLLSQGVIEIIICVGYGSRVIQDHFGHSYRGRKIRYSTENKPLGTGGALSKALDSFKPEKPFLAANGDTYFPVDSSSLVATLGEATWAIASFPATDSGRYGALDVGPQGQVLGLTRDEEGSSHADAQIFQANSGLWVGNPAKISLPLWAGRRQYSLDDYLSQGVRSGEVIAKSKAYSVPFIDIGLPTDFARAQTMSGLKVFW